MKKLILSLSVIGLFIFYSAYKQSNGSMLASSTTPTAPPPDANNPTAVPQTSSPTSAAATQPTSSAPAPTSVPPTSAPRGQYKDGSYTGDTVDVFYGNVQVQAIVQGGKITDVKFLQYPSDRRTSVEINSQAMPMLTSQAIQTQSANVDGVSGASATSQGFVTSLSSALAKAK